MTDEEFVKKWCEMFDLASVVELDDFMQKREHIHMLPKVLAKSEVAQFITVGSWVYPNELIMLIDDLPTAYMRDNELAFEPVGEGWSALYEVK